MKKKRKFLSEKNLVFIIIVVAILVRLLYLPIPFIINVADGAGYVAMADEALRGHWASFFDNYIYRTPLYPFFIAFTKIIFGNFWRPGLAWSQHLLGVVMPVLIYLIGKRVFSKPRTKSLVRGKEVGFLAGLLTAVNTYQLYWEHNSMSDFFFTFMTVFAFYFFFKALTKQRKRDYLIFGTLFGFNLLIRPIFQTFFLFFPFLIYLFILKQNPKTKFVKSFKETMKRFALIMLPAFIIILPWLFQHWYRHRYIGLTPFLGVGLMVRAQNYMDFKSPLRAKEKRVYLQTMIEVGECDALMIISGRCGQVAVAGWADLQSRLGYSAVEADQALKEIGLEAIKKNPGRYLKETVEQIRIFLTTYRQINFFADMDLDPSFQEEYLSRIKNDDRLTIFHQKINWKLTFKPSWIVLLAFFGMLLALIKKNLKSLLFALVVLYIIFITCAVGEGGVTRYRIPADPFMFIFAAYGLISIFKGIYYILKEGIKEETNTYEDSPPSTKL